MSLGRARARAFRRAEVVTACLLMALAWASRLNAADRIVAVGDVHGSYDGLVSILRSAAVIDSDLRWSGGRTTVVQTGDLLDRGVEVRKVMDLLIRLQIEAAAAGGEVIVLLGNHEAMNLLGILRDVDPEVFATFTDSRSGKRRKAAFREFKRFWDRRVREAGMKRPTFAGVEKQWYASRPLGFVEYVEALSNDGDYGTWLRSCRAAAMVGDTLFVHGGFGPELADLSIERVNTKVGEELAAFDIVRSWAVRSGLALPSASIYELAQVADAVVGEGQADRGGGGQEQEAEILPWLELIARWQEWYLIDPEGPLWFRGAALWDEAENEQILLGQLDSLGAARLVVGHTPQRTGDVTARFGGRVFLIDTGMLSSVYHGRPAALEIAGGEVAAIYEDRREVLVIPAAPTPCPP
jgi:hypothetical protein